MRETVFRPGVALAILCVLVFSARSVLEVGLVIPGLIVIVSLASVLPVPGCLVDRLVPKMEPRLRLSRAAQTEIRCAYCHDSVGVREGLACGRCSTVLHDACWSESRVCPVLGCAPRNSLARFL